MTNFIVFTDLDATLLNHEDYAYDDAEPALKALAENNIPLILNSSKTIAEISALKEEMNNPYPCVAENGSVIDWCDEMVERIEIQGVAMEVILNSLDGLSRDFKFKGFSQFSAEELASEINLPLETARRSKERHASEPLKWLDSDEKLVDFEKQISESGLQTLRGGRFVHVMGNTDKSLALKKIYEHYSSQYNSELITVALGDSPNDKLMLEMADIGILIPNPHAKSWSKKGAFATASQPGAAGWNEQILKLLNEKKGNLI